MSGIKLIALERQRQINEEGWTPEHDDFHDQGQLAVAGAIYASPNYLRYPTKNYLERWDVNRTGTPEDWPWHPVW